MSQIIFSANDKYYGELTQDYQVGDSIIYLTAVPNNVPTILVAGRDTVNETVFSITNKTINSVTGVTRLRGANVELLTQTPITCLNNEEFINQYNTKIGELYTVPAAGTANQVLRKIDGTDNNTEWHTPAKADVGLSSVDNTADTTKLTATLLAVYPVGAIYMSVVSTSPATLFGGTWSAWGTGRVPVGIDASQTEFDTIEETGGAKTHTLQTTEMPSHSHRDMMWGENSGSYFGVNGGGAGTWQFAYSTSACDANFYTSRTGGGLAHNNLQPYITCYMWKRTA